MSGKTENRYENGEFRGFSRGKFGEIYFPLKSTIQQRGPESHPRSAPPWSPPSSRPSSQLRSLQEHQVRRPPPGRRSSTGRGRGAYPDTMRAITKLDSPENVQKYLILLKLFIKNASDQSFVSLSLMLNTTRGALTWKVSASCVFSRRSRLWLLYFQLILTLRSFSHIRCLS